MQCIMYHCCMLYVHAYTHAHMLHLHSTGTQTHTAEAHTHPMWEHLTFKCTCTHAIIQYLCNHFFTSLYSLKLLKWDSQCHPIWYPYKWQYWTSPRLVWRNSNKLILQWAYYCIVHLCFVGVCVRVCVRACMYIYVCVCLRQDSQVVRAKAW